MVPGIRRSAAALILAAASLLAAACSTSYEVVETVAFGGDRSPLVAAPEFLAVDPASLSSGEAIAVVQAGASVIVPASVSHVVLERLPGTGGDASSAAGGAASLAPPQEATGPPDRVGGFSLGTAAAQGWGTDVDGFERTVRIRLAGSAPGRVTCRFCLTNEGEGEADVRVDLYWRLPAGVRIVGTVDAAVVSPNMVRKVLLYVPYVRFAALALSAESYGAIKPRHKVVNGDLLRLGFEGVRLGPGHGLVVDCEAEVTPGR